MEAKTCAHYVKNKGAFRVKNGQRSMYLCHRSGVDRCKDDEEKTRLRRQHSVKTGAQCPAHFVATVEDDGKTNVTFHSVHAGHEPGLKHLKLTRKEREDLATRIRGGESLESILDNVKKSVAALHTVYRENILDRKDLLNIIRDFNLDPDKSHQNDDKIC
jgi:hypothetical protein